MAFSVKEIPKKFGEELRLRIYNSAYCFIEKFAFVITAFIFGRKYLETLLFFNQNAAISVYLQLA